MLKTRSGDILHVALQTEEQKLLKNKQPEMPSYLLSGPAVEVFRGELESTLLDQIQ